MRNFRRYSNNECIFSEALPLKRTSLGLSLLPYGYFLGRLYSRCTFIVNNNPRLWHVLTERMVEGWFFIMWLYTAKNVWKSWEPAYLTDCSTTTSSRNYPVIGCDCTYCIYITCTLSGKDSDVLLSADYFVFWFYGFHSRKILHFKRLHRRIFSAYQYCTSLNPLIIACNTNSRKLRILCSICRQENLRVFSKAVKFVAFAADL